MQKFLDEKKEWAKSDVDFAKKKFVKKNTLFKMMSDNFKENEDYDELHKSFRVYERKCLDLEFYSQS